MRLLLLLLPVAAAASSSLASAPRFAGTKFSALSPAEFKKSHRSGYTGPQQHGDGESEHITAAALAGGSVDWRKHGAVSKVYDQGSCGCCWAMSATAAIEGQMVLRNKTSKVPSLSWQQLICCDCGRGDVGCDGGDPHSAYGYIQDVGGLESSSGYPFTDGGPVMPWEDRCNQNDKCHKCKFTKANVVAAVTGYKNVTVTKNETALQATVATEGPVSICINSDPWQLYSGGVLDHSTCPSTGLDHCVLVVGFDADASPPYWIVKNSWGSDWGENGYIRLKMGGNVCGLANVPTLPMVASP